MAERIAKAESLLAQVGLKGQERKFPWVALVVLAALGVIMYAITAYIEQSMTGWAQRSEIAA
jgi:hypothetical protein